MKAVSKITFTDRARQMVLSFITDDGAEDEALRISVSGSPAAPHYDLTLVPRSERTEDEAEIEQDGFRVLLRAEDVPLLEGSTVDYVDRVNESGFEVRPAKDPPATPEQSGEEPVGEIADRVRSVLESQVNPAIAAHGGMISLVEVQETDVYVEMSGGCQGCALSRMTLRQGVERMLREAVPELTVVHDVTDHTSGDNPYL
jgi:Fe/S biogenesis protein NfuA